MMRKLLYTQFRFIQHYRAELLDDEENEEYLHQLRLAVRRFRSVLHMFPVLSDAVQFSEIDSHLFDFLESLGVIRDIQLWVIELEDLKEKKIFKYDESVISILADAKDIKIVRNASLRKLLKSKSTKKLLDNITNLLRIDMPNLTRDKRLVGDADTYIVEKLNQKFNEVLKVEKVLDRNDSESLHIFRMSCRELRYWVEFANPVLSDSRWNKIGKCMQKIATSLGVVHDYDLRLNFIKEAGADSSDLLRDYLNEKRSKAFGKFENQWLKVLKNS
jgi:CHAD domain-containing protein